MPQPPKAPRVVPGEPIQAASLNALAKGAEQLSRTSASAPLALQDGVTRGLRANVPKYWQAKILGSNGGGSYSISEVLPTPLGTWVDPGWGRTGTAWEFNADTAVPSGTVVDILDYDATDWYFRVLRGGSGCGSTCITLHNMRDGKAYKNVTVQLYDYLGTLEASGLTDDSGRFCFTAKQPQHDYTANVTIDNGYGGTCVYPLAVHPCGNNEFWLCRLRFTLDCGVEGFSEDTASIGASISFFNGLYTFGNFTDQGGGTYTWDGCFVFSKNEFPAGVTIYYFAGDDYTEGGGCRRYLSNCDTIDVPSCADLNATLTLTAVPADYYDATCSPCPDVCCGEDIGCVGGTSLDNRGLISKTLNVTFDGDNGPPGTIALTYAGEIDDGTGNICPEWHSACIPDVFNVYCYPAGHFCGEFPADIIGTLPAIAKLRGCDITFDWVPCAAAPSCAGHPSTTLCILENWGNTPPCNGSTTVASTCHPITSGSNGCSTISELRSMRPPKLPASWPATVQATILAKIKTIDASDPEITRRAEYESQQRATSGNAFVAVASAPRGGCCA